MKQAADAEKAAAAKQAAEAKKLADAKKAAEARKLAEAKQAAEAKRIADAKKAAEARKLAEAQQAAEAKRIADAKKAEEARKLAEAKQAAEAKRIADAKIAEAKQAAEAKRIADAKLAEAQKAAEAKRIAEAQQAAEAKRIADAKKAAAEKERQALLARRRAEDAYEKGMGLYGEGKLEAAGTELRKVVDAGKLFGDKRDEKLAAALKDIRAKLNAEKDARASAYAYLGSAEKSLKEEDYVSAEAYLQQALDNREKLSLENRQKLGALLQELDAKRKAQVKQLAIEKSKAGGTDADVVRADQWLNEVIVSRDVMQEALKKRAEQEVLLAKNDFERERYESAQQHVKKALELDPANQVALDLKDDLDAIAGKTSHRVLGKDVDEAIRARIDKVRMDRDTEIQRGDLARENERYSEAITRYEIALEYMEYLRRYETNPALENKVTLALKHVRAAKVAADAKLAEQQVRDANVFAEKEAIDRRGIAERQKIVRFKEANAEYARGKYRSAINLAEQVLELDPENTAALDLRDEAREKIKRRTWGAVYEAQDKNWEDHRIHMRDILTWPGGHVEYPAKEAWQEITGRGGVQLPSAKAVKTPKELQLEAVLDTEIEGFQFDETSLTEVITFFKNLLGDKIDFKIDQAIVNEDILITLSLGNITLRRALRAMLWDRGLNFIVSSNGYIYISSIDGCRRAEAEPWNLSMRQYNIQDLLIDLTTSGGTGTGGTNDDDDSSSSSSYNDDDDDDSTRGSGNGAVSPETIMAFLIFFTGGMKNWDVASSLSQTDSNNDDDDSSSNRSSGSSGGDSLSSLMGGGEEGADVGDSPGRIMIEWQGWLMVNHVDRMHKNIENVLSQLRSQERAMIEVEARVLTFTDDFYKEFSISFSENGNAAGWNWRTRGRDVDTGASPLSVLGKGVNWTSTVNPSAHSPVPGTLSNSLFSLTASFLGTAGRQIVLQAVKDSQFARVASAPHLLCMNTQRREVSFTQTGTYVSGYEEQGNFLVPTYDEYTISDTTLEVRPVVSADQRYVTLTINIDTTIGTLQPRATSIIVGSSDTAPGTQWNVNVSDLSETAVAMEATTKIPDRGTLVLGGIMDASEQSGEGTVPILGSIPILKRLFVDSAMNRERRHNIFLVTPTIIMWDEIEP